MEGPRGRRAQRSAGAPHQPSFASVLRLPALRADQVPGGDLISRAKRSGRIYKAQCSQASGARVPLQPRAPYNLCSRAVTPPLKTLFPSAEDGSYTRSLRLVRILQRWQKPPPPPLPASTPGQPVGRAPQRELRAVGWGRLTRFSKSLLCSSSRCLSCLLSGCLWNLSGQAFTEHLLRVGPPFRRWGRS